MKQIWTGITTALAVVLLTGCLFPSDQRGENQVPYEDQLQSVQSAVTQYREDTSVLPIQTRDAETSVFQRYPVNFRTLVPSYLQQAPGNSFENGGTFQYVLTNVEEEAEVKLVDLRSSNKLQDLNRRINQYRSQNQYAPVEEAVGPGILKLDYESLHYREEQTVPSPYHPDHRLPIHMATNGDLVIDYSLDIRHYIEEYGLGDFSEGDDLRWLLVEHAPFVPAHSKPMTIEDGEIIFKSE
ncbi:hypothetical protein CR205_07530 [Alteribacter lacisalsi]|uniref:Uncharacterized protein n=1 Tax=Alteribacter lacisalsi TaxID=2045244 RepID=A0A2W0HLL4_9BACI|nr:hypothetical protein [Alteribacter lacisalsi]PYZ98435.1 hypothetical protein CR205_07530 [Alteribacter lacisalsi]